MKRREFLIRSSLSSAAALSTVRLVPPSPAAMSRFRATTRRPTAGPLRVHSENSRYLADRSGRLVFLTGSHTWANLQETKIVKSRMPDFDYAAYLDFLESYNHNFFRLWAWESATWVHKGSVLADVDPLPFARTGPGRALDGKPKFDVTRFDPVYFKRLRRRVMAARDRGFYVGVMLFQGFSVARKSRARKQTPWVGHPFHRANNINGIDGDTDGDGEGYDVHTLTNPAVTRAQEAYVRKVIDTVNDLDNVLYEISNESHGGSTQWQYHFIRFIHEYERTKPKQHPVWMSFQWDGVSGSGKNEDLWRSPAEVVSPARNDRNPRVRPYRSDPPAENAGKVVLLDTDHLWGIGGNASWPWKCLARGLQPLFMDPYHDSVIHPGHDIEAKWEPLRRAMGQVRSVAQRIDLASMTPRTDLASTRYCLADPGREYLVYLPEGGRVTVDLSAAKKPLAVEWIDPRTGKATKGGEAARATRRTFEPPSRGEAVLHLRLRR